MFIRVLGSAAGGGFPQWNCNCNNCNAVRTGKPGFKERTQSSIVVSKDGENWILFNASPDILTQLKSAGPRLQPARKSRDTGIKAVVLMDAQIDHTTGLLMLRESNKPLPVYASSQVKEDLTTGNPLFNVLKHYCTVDWKQILPSNDIFFEVPDVDDISLLTMALKSAAPPYSPHRNNPQVGDNIGVVLKDNKTKKTVFYAPGLCEIESHLEESMNNADVLLIDGTFWTNNEMLDLGLSKKSARDMGHNPQSGSGGMLEALSSIKGPRKILIHINNTNPILDENSPERAELFSQGIEVAYDGMEIEV
jgi:pyrroloquinoline quinone biosynthesis protein B